MKKLIGILLPGLLAAAAGPAGATVWNTNYNGNLDLSQWTRLDCGGTGGSCPCNAPVQSTTGTSTPTVQPQFSAGRCDPLSTATTSSHMTPNPVSPGAGSRAQIVPDPAGVSGNVLRIQLHPGDAFADGSSVTTRVEFANDRQKGNFTTYVAGDDYYFGFSVYFPSASFEHWHCSDTLPAATPPLNDNSYTGRCPGGVPDTSAAIYGAWNVVTQWHGPAGPDMGFYLQRLFAGPDKTHYQLNLANFDGGIWHDSGDPTKSGAIFTDTWYHFVVHVTFGTPGTMELWKAMGDGAFVKQVFNGVHSDDTLPGTDRPTVCTSVGDGTVCTGNTMDPNSPAFVIFKQGHYRNPTLTDSTSLYYNHTSSGTHDEVFGVFAASAPADFGLAMSPAGVTSAPGGTGTSTATVTPSGGFTGSVALSVSGLPSGATASFSPTSITGGSGNSTLTLHAGTAAAGTYALTVSGVSGAITHTTPLSYVISSATAYTADTAWLRQVGTANDEYGWGVAVDGSGNVVVAGYTTGAISDTNQGGEDLIVRKYSSTGTLLWSTQLGTTGNQHSSAVTIDSAGDVYVTGYTTAVFWDAYHGGLHDAFVAKLHGATGVDDFSVEIGTTGDDIGNGIAVDGSGNIYVSGTTTGALTGTNAGGTDAWVAKYNPAMTQQWVRQFGGAGNESVGGLAVDSAGNVYVAGSTTAAFGGQAYNGGAHDAFLVKYNTSGTLQWTKIRGTAGDDVAHAVAVIGGNPVIAGSTSGDLGFTNQGGLDAWFGEYLASNAAYINERQVGGIGDDEAWGVAGDASGNIYLTGSNNAAMYLDYQGGYDIFAAKYDASRARTWLKNLGSAGNEVGLAAAASGTTLFVAGGTNSSLGATSSGGFDLIIAAFTE